MSQWQGWQDALDKIDEGGLDEGWDICRACGSWLETGADGEIPPHDRLAEGEPLYSGPDLFRSGRNVVVLGEPVRVRCEGRQK